MHKERPENKSRVRLGQFLPNMVFTILKDNFGGIASQITLLIKLSEYHSGISYSSGNEETFDVTTICFLVIASNTGKPNPSYKDGYAKHTAFS